MDTPEARNMPEGARVHRDCVEPQPRKGRHGLERVSG